MTKVMNWIGSSKFPNSQEMDFQRRFLEIDQPDTRIAYGSQVRLLTSELTRTYLKGKLGIYHQSSHS